MENATTTLSLFKQLIGFNLKISDYTVNLNPFFGCDFSLHLAISNHKITSDFEVVFDPLSGPQRFFKLSRFYRF